MIIQEITKNNYLTENEEGLKELQVKFNLVDSLIENNDHKRLAFLCERDPTRWAYAFLTNKNGVAAFKKLMLDE